MKKKYERISKIVELVDRSEISSIQSVVSGIINVINDPDSSAKDLKGYALDLIVEDMEQEITMMEDHGLF